ncbi:colossin C [Tieghemostelium lacteum]|uniref:Colossin C n=1 Tax=Tieghemostelium lacteum TaxID=361077 RepID=A0A151ZIC1_TIELA|nr:colossin C [Tieghemostelium lacteum]|eukprot:KYQ93713.1 colossin C [Tieghemostelium lacteum]
MKLLILLFIISIVVIQNVDSTNLVIALKGRTFLDLNNNALYDDGEPGFPGVIIEVSNTTDHLGNTFHPRVTPDNGEFIYDGLRERALYTFKFYNPAGYSFEEHVKSLKCLPKKNCIVDVEPGSTPLVATKLIQDTYAFSIPLIVTNKETANSSVLTLQFTADFTPKVIVPAVNITGSVYHDTNGDGIPDTLSKGTVILMNALTKLTAYDVYNKTVPTLPAGGFIFNNVPQRGSYYIVLSDNEVVHPGILDSPHLTPEYITAKMDHGAVKVLYSFPMVDNNSWNSGSFFYDRDGNGKYNPGEPWTPGVNVLAYLSNGDLYGNVTTGSDGKWSILGIKSPFTLHLVFNYPSSIISGAVPNNMTVVGGTESPPIPLFQFDPLSINTGQIVYDTDSNGKVSPGDHGVPGVKASLYLSNGNLFDSTYSGQDGKWSIAGIRPSNQNIRIELSYPKEVMNTPDLPKSIDTKGGSNIPTILVYLADPNSDTTGGYLYDVDKDGLPSPADKGIPGVLVTITLPNGQKKGPIVTGEDGKWLFPDIPSTIMAHVDFTYPKDLLDTLPKGVYLPKSIDVQGGEDYPTILVYKDDHSSTTSGSFLYDGDNSGTPTPTDTGISGIVAHIYLPNGQEYGSAVTDENGKWSIIGVPSSIPIRVDFVYPDGKSIAPYVPNSFTTKGGKEIPPFMVYPYDKDSVTGGYVLLDVDGKPNLNDKGVEGVNVRVHLPSNEMIKNLHTNKEGKWSVEGIPSSVNLRLEYTYPSGYITVGAPTSVIVAGGTNNIIVYVYTLNESLTTSGGVYLDKDFDGKYKQGEEGVGGVHIYVKLPNGQYYVNLTTTQNGGWSFTGVPKSLPLSIDYEYPDTVIGLVDSNVQLGGSSLLIPVYSRDSSSITQGVIFEDKDFNNIFSAGDRGVPIVNIKIYLPNGQVFANLFTGPNGKYSVSGLPKNMPIHIEYKYPADYITTGAPTSKDVFGGDIESIPLYEYDPDSITQGSIFIDRDVNGLPSPGEPGVKDVQVLMYLPNGQLFSNLTTDPSGNWSVPGIPNTVSVKVQIKYPDTIISNGAPTMVNVLGGSTIPPTPVYPYDPSSNTHGSVYIDKNYNNILDSNDPGVPGASVILFLPNGQLYANKVTGQDGKWTVPGLPSWLPVRAEFNYPKGLIATGAPVSSITHGGADIQSQLYLYDQNSLTSGMIYFDKNYDDEQQLPDENPISEIPVHFTLPNGHVYANVKTGQDGKYSVPGLPSDMPIRIDHILPKGTVSTGQATSAFVKGNADLKPIGLFPQDKTNNAKGQDIPSAFLTTCFVRGRNNGKNADHTAIVKVSPDAIGRAYEGDGMKYVTQLATHAQVGAVFGVDYYAYRREIYAAAYLKTNSDYGPGGNCAIYKIDEETKNTSVFLNLADFFGKNYCGNVVHPFDFSEERTVANEVGKNSFGQLTIDGHKLYVTNLKNNELIEIKLNEVPTPSNIRRYPVPSQCQFEGNWRIHSINMYQDTANVGGVCNGEFNATDLSMHVLRLDSKSGLFTPIFHSPLNYTKGCRILDVFSVCQPAKWSPWSTKVQSQAMLSSIAFDDNHHLTLSLKDRLGDMGNEVSAPDLLMACLDKNGVYQLESDGKCGGLTGADLQATSLKGDRIGVGPHGGYFYENEASKVHDYTSTFGAVRGGPGIIVGTGFDYSQLYEGAIRWYNTTNGKVIKGFGLYVTTRGTLFAHTFGKQNGLGDISSTYQPYVSQYRVGRVWLDNNSNGIQDPNERGLSNISVLILPKENMNLVMGILKTDENGYFTYKFEANRSYYCVSYVDNIVENIGSFNLSPSLKSLNPDLNSDAFVLNNKIIGSIIQVQPAGGYYFDQCHFGIVKV